MATAGSSSGPEHIASLSRKVGPGQRLGSGRLTARAPSRGWNDRISNSPSVRETTDARIVAGARASGRRVLATVGPDSATSMPCSAQVMRRARWSVCRRRNTWCLRCRHIDGTEMGARRTGSCAQRRCCDRCWSHRDRFDHGRGKPSSDGFAAGGGGNFAKRSGEAVRELRRRNVRVGRDASHARVRRDMGATGRDQGRQVTACSAQPERDAARGDDRRRGVVVANGGWSPRPTRLLRHRPAAGERWSSRAS